MFKNLTLLRVVAVQPISASDLHDALADALWQPCAPTQPVSLGWTPPRGHEHGSLVEQIDSDWIMRLKVEQRVLPTQAVKRRVQELADKVHEETGRKPGKKALAELKEQATHELLPKAFTRQSHVNVWLAADLGLLALDTTSDTRIDEICALLIQAWPGLTIAHLQTQMAPGALMAKWLLEGDTDYVGFSLGGETKLKAPDGTKATVAYTNHSLDRAEIVDHIKAGKAVTLLGLAYNERVAFTLTEAMRLKRVELLDLAFEGRQPAQGDEAFDADVALTCGEFRLLVPALIGALDGEREHG